MAAKPKQPSMLTRQRQLRRQQQATKAASRNQLPSSGKTTANSTRATAQRAGTAVRQRANQDMATLRALADNMKRNQARDARQIKPDPSPSTRYVGPKGANPQGQRQLPQGNKGGPMQTKGGPMVKAGSSQVSRASQPTQTRQARAEVVSSPKRNSNPRPNRGAIEKAGPTIDVKANAEKLPAGRQGGAMSRAESGSLTARAGGRSPASTASGRNVRGGGMTAAVIAALAEPLVDQAGQKLGKELGNRVLKPIGRRLDDMMPGVNSRDEADRKRRSQPLPEMTPAERAKAVRLKQAEPSDVARTTTLTPAPRPRTAGTQSSGRPRSASQQPTASIPSAPRAPQVPTAPRAPKEASAPKAPDMPSMSGVGPVKDGELYADKLKISQIQSGNEPDMERRRAFLDAKDSMSGLKAVKELLAKRKKRMGEG